MNRHRSAKSDSTLNTHRNAAKRTSGRRFLPQITALQYVTRTTGLQPGTDGAVGPGKSREFTHRATNRWRDLATRPPFFATFYPGLDAAPTQQGPSPSG